MSEPINKINLRFESGNSVPVDSVRITREEWDAVRRELEARRASEKMQIALRRKADEWRDAALEREQDKAAYAQQLRLDYQALCEKLTSAEEREQALAAHVEALEAKLSPIPWPHEEQPDGYVTPLSREEVFGTPATSLARRDLIKQAEALEEVADWIDPVDIADHAKELRQQAENL